MQHSRLRLLLFPYALQQDGLKIILCLTSGGHQAKPQTLRFQALQLAVLKWLQARRFKFQVARSTALFQKRLATQMRTQSAPGQAAWQHLHRFTLQWAFKFNLRPLNRHERAKDHAFQLREWVRSFDVLHACEAWVQKS